MNHELNTKILPTLLAVLLSSSLILLSITKPVAESNGAAVYPVLNEPQLNAHAYLVKIIGDEHPLIKQREWKKLPPASLTKLLTAVVASEIISPENKIVFSEQAKKVEPKLSGTKAGEIFLRDDVIRLALIESANDAALALAESVGLDKFMAAMNEKAKSLKLLNSNFENPMGLDAKSHLSTAEDLAKLAEYAWREHPELLEITRTQETTIFSAEGRKYQVKNTNELLKEFPAIIGGKTGFTDNAKGALLFLYPVRPDKTAIVVLLGSEDRFGDGRKVIRWLENLLLYTNPRITTPIHE